MRKEYSERGSGMTRKKYVRTHISSKDSKEDHIEFSKNLRTFEEELKDSAEFCKQRLRAHGLPDMAFVTLCDVAEPIHTYVVERLGHEEDSNVGYAARILWHLDLALRPSIQERLWDFAYNVYWAASLATEATLKFGKWEKLALKGEEQLKWLVDARVKSAESRARVRDEIAADFECEARVILQETPNLKPHGVAMQIHERRKNENPKRSEKEQLPNQSPKHIRNKIKHLWE